MNSVAAKKKEKKHWSVLFLRVGANMKCFCKYEMLCKGAEVSTACVLVCTPPWCVRSIVGNPQASFQWTLAIESKCIDLPFHRLMSRASTSRRSWYPSCRGRGESIFTERQNIFLLQLVGTQFQCRFRKGFGGDFKEGYGGGFWKVWQEQELKHFMLKNIAGCTYNCQAK